MVKNCLIVKDITSRIQQRVTWIVLNLDKILNIIER